jgi:hypothetical protein
MNTTVYRNVDLSQLVLTQLPKQIARIHKDTANEFIAARGLRDGSYSVFAFKKFQKPKKYGSVDAIPDEAIPMPSSIGITTNSGRNLAAFVAREFVRLFLQMAPRKSDTYRNGLRLTLNGRLRALSTIMKIQEFNPLKPGEIIEVWSAVEYASTLEAPNYNVDGIFLKITRILLARYSQSCAIRFTYRSGGKMGLAFKYATPVVMIGARGEFASSTTTRRGYQMRRRKREAARAQLQKLNATRAKQGLAPLKRNPRKKKAP